jgi:hypothetical protein
MPILHLGVIDIPYSDGNGETTSDVARILEDEYHIMEVFVADVGQDAIAATLEKSAVEALEKIILGSPAPISLSNAGEAEIETAFRQFLSQQEMDNVVGGVPTKAALAGVSHRRKRPNAKGNPERPSFIDTGLFSASFRAWVE